MQPPPQKTDTPEVWPLVVADVRRGSYCDGLPAWHRERLAQAMERRAALGRERYGVGLQVENGRDAMLDATEEALDLCAYSRQAWEQTRRSDDWDTHLLAVRLAARLVWRISLRAEEAA